MAGLRKGEDKNSAHFLISLRASGNVVVFANLSATPQHRRTTDCTGSHWLIFLSELVQLRNGVC